MKWITNFQDERDIKTKTEKLDSQKIIWVISDPQPTKFYSLNEMKNAGIQGLYS